MGEEFENVVCRKFSLNIISAENLPNVRKVFTTRAYAKISIRSADKKIKSRTDVDKENELNPVWNHPMAYEMAESGVHCYGLTVAIKVYAERTCGDRYIGEVNTNVKDLFDSALAQGGNAKLSLPIMRGSTEETGGILNFCYSFEEPFTVRKSDFQEKIGCFGGWFTPEVATKVAIQVAKHAIFFGILPLL